MTITLQFKVNAGAPQTGAAEIAAEDEIDLLLASYSGLRSIRYEIQEYPADFPAPAGWSTDASSGTYYFNANSIVGLTPPTLTMPTTAEIDAGQWGKWIFRAIGTTASGTVVSNPRCMVKIPSPSLGLNGIAFTEENESNAQRAWAGDLQEDLVEIDAAALVSGGFVSSAAATRPIKVSGASGAVTWSWEPNANVGMLGYGFTACPSVVNAGGGLSLTAGAGAASLAGSTTATVSAGAGALTLTGATDVNITATTDDIGLTAGDAIVIDAAGSITIDAGTTCDLAATTLKASGIATGVSGVVAIAADGTLSRTAAGGASATAAYLIDSASAVNVNDVPIRALAGQLSFARSVAANNVAVDVLDVKATTTDPAFGDADFGSSLTFSAVGDNNNPVVVGRLAATLTDPTDGDEDGKLTVDVISAGSPTSVLTLSGAGDLTATGSVAAGTGGFRGVSLDRATSGSFAFGATNITALTITPNTTVSGTLTKTGAGLTTTVVAGILGENTTAALVGTQVQNGYAIVSKGRIWDTGSASSKTVVGGFFLEGIGSSSAAYRLRLCVDTGTGTLASLNTYETNNAPGIGGQAFCAPTFVTLTDVGNGYRGITTSGTEYFAVKTNSDSAVFEAKRNTSTSRAEVWSNITTGSTDDGARVWNYAGTRTAGNLIAFGDGGSWTERAAVEYDGIYDGPRLRKTSLKTENYTAAAWDLILCDPSGGGFTVTIPAGTTALTGRRIGVKNYGTSTNTITISAASGSIEGGSPTITTAWGYYELECVGTDGWVVVAKVA